jgi:hypothetical protein
MADEFKSSRERDPHGHTGPTTPGEDSSREAHPAVVPQSDKVKIAEEASREEDA